MINKDRLIKFIINILPLFIYTIITCIVFFNKIINIKTGYGMPDVDTDGTLWYYWARTFTEQNGLFFNTQIPLAYPFGYDVSHIPYFSLFYELIIFIIKRLGNSIDNITLVSNIFSLITYPLSAFITYLLTNYLTKNKIASFFAGLIFSFSFYFILMQGGALSLNQMWPIPLFFLSLFYFINKKNVLSLLLSAFMFSALFMVNAYWAFFSAIFTLPILIFYYKESDIKLKIKNIAIYYLAFIGILVSLNIGFLIQNTTDNIQYGNKIRAVNKSSELLPILSYFAPHQNNFLYKDIIPSYKYTFLGYVALIIGIIGFFAIKNKEEKRKYNAIAICFILSLLLSSSIPGFTIINDIYFKFFGAFRAVSRLNILSTLFLSIMVSFSIKQIYEYNIKEYINKNKAYLLIFIPIGLIVSILIVLEGLNTNYIWTKITRISGLKQVYEPIKNNSDIKIIAQYPMGLSNGDNGYPPNFQLIGQIIHNKILVTGADPFNPNSMDYYKTINEISNRETIDNLAKYNVDTIIVNKDVMNDQILIDKLKNDNRLIYIGNYKGEYDNSSYFSTNEQSRNIEVFQIKSVVEKNESKK